MLKNGNNISKSKAAGEITDHTHRICATRSIGLHLILSGMLVSGLAALGKDFCVKLLSSATMATRTNVNSQNHFFIAIY